MYWEYLKSLLRHKWFVLVECVRLGVPLLGILHDWSKFLPSEFIPYARHFYGEWPSEEDRIVSIARGFGIQELTTERAKAAFDVAWLHHQKRNRHHPQYWLLQYDFNDEWVVSENGNETWVDFHNGSDPLSFTAYFETGCGETVLQILSCKPVPLPMPDRYRREMLGDWLGAGRAYGNPDTQQWYLDNKDKIILHPETRARIEEQLGVRND